MYNHIVNVRSEVVKENPLMAYMLPKKVHIKIALSFKDEIFATTRSGKLNMLGVEMPIPGTEGRSLFNLGTQSVRDEIFYNGSHYYSSSARLPKSEIAYGTSTKKIAGYLCKEATIITEDKIKYYVWYTTEIPYAYSPEGLDFAALKGAVLEYGNKNEVCKISGQNLLRMR